MNYRFVDLSSPLMTTLSTRYPFLYHIARLLTFWYRWLVWGFENFNNPYGIPGVPLLAIIGGLFFGGCFVVIAVSILGTIYYKINSAMIKARIDRKKEEKKTSQEFESFEHFVKEPENEKKQNVEKKTKCEYSISELENLNDEELEEAINKIRENRKC